MNIDINADYPIFRSKSINGLKTPRAGFEPACALLAFEFIRRRELMPSGNS